LQVPEDGNGRRGIGRGGRGGRGHDGGCSLFRPERYGLPATGTPAAIGDDRVTIGVATRDRRCELER
jgi:hypothetical protein